MNSLITKKLLVATVTMSIFSIAQVGIAADKTKTGITEKGFSQPIHKTGRNAKAWEPDFFKPGMNKGKKAIDTEPIAKPGLVGRDLNGPDLNTIEIQFD